MHRIPSILWDKQEIKRMQNNANTSSSPRSPRRAWMLSHSPVFISAVAYSFPCCTLRAVFSHFHDRQAQLTLLPPAPFVAGVNFPACIHVQRVYSVKASARSWNADGLPCSAGSSASLCLATATQSCSSSLRVLPKRPRSSG